MLLETERERRKRQLFDTHIGRNAICSEKHCRMGVMKGIECIRGTAETPRQLHQPSDNPTPQDIMWWCSAAVVGRP